MRPWHRTRPVRWPSYAPPRVTPTCPGGTSWWLRTWGAASAAALEFAFDLASTEGRALDVVHTWVDPETIIALDSYEQRLLHRDEHDRAFSEHVAGYADKYPDVAVKRHLSDEDPARALLQLSRTASTVVVGTRGQTGVHSLLGSVSRELVEGAHCTVVVVRP